MLSVMVCEGEQLVEALRYKPEGRGIHSRWCHWNSGRTISLGSTKPLTQMSTRNISRGQRRPLRETQHPGTLRACPFLYKVLLYLYLMVCGGGGSDLVSHCLITSELLEVVILPFRVSSIWCLLYPWRQRV